MTIDIGTIITHGASDYQVVSLLKSGGFGRAFLAEKSTKPLNFVKTPVVIKVPKIEVLADPVWSKKFAREARILANISHPNVVKIIAYWEFPNGDKALVQELVLGAKELTGFCAAQAFDASSVFLQTLYGLRAFHAGATPSAVHRDLSPSNILIGSDGGVKIIDFGLAKEDPRVTQKLTVAGSWFGTPGCMSPEQLVDSGSVDHRTDLFAVGRSFAASIQNRDPQHADPSRLPEPWRTLCVKLTEHDEAARYQSANETIAAALLLFAQHQVPLAHFEVHVREAAGRPPVPGWAELAALHFQTITDLHQTHIRYAAELDAWVFAMPAFGAGALFDRLEASPAISTFQSGNASFDDADPLGELYQKLFPALDSARRLLCFRRLCRTAVSYHRFSVMDNVRSTFALETDPAARAALVQILEEEDTGKVIWGAGVIPRTT